MKLKSIKLWCLPSLIFLNGMAALAHGDSNQVDPSAADSTPYINPVRDCITEGMVNPAGKNYRYLYSRDCKVVYVLPPPVMPQVVKTVGTNLQSCEVLASSQTAINTLQATLNDIQTRERQLETDLYNAKTPADTARIAAKLEVQRANETHERDNLQVLQASQDLHFGQVPGSISSVLLLGNVSQDELNAIRGMNNANLNRILDVEVHSTGPDGKPVVTTTHTIQQSSLRTAPISSSLYSFTYRIPDNAIANGGIVSTDIPGLEYLEQQASKTGTISVRANDVVSGQVKLALTVACTYAKPDASGTWRIVEDVDPMFSVNRTFQVQEMFAQGYTATLKVDKVVDQITKYLTTNTNAGFQKSVVFEPTIKADVDQLLDFRWDSDYDNGKDATLQQIFDIKTAVTTKLIDDYIETLVKSKILDIQDNPTIDPAKGGYTDDTRVANRCWSEGNGGLSGMFGGRHSVCADYTYTVKVWHDGVTSEQLHTSLTLNGTTGERMTINQVTPFNFTTAFTK